MSLYYDADGITLYLGDCTVHTEWLAADVLITDPPYGIDGHLSAGYKGKKPAGGFVRVNAKPEWDETLAARDAALTLWGGCGPMPSLAALLVSTPLPRTESSPSSGTSSWSEWATSGSRGDAGTR